MQNDKVFNNFKKQVAGSSLRLTKTRKQIFWVLFEAKKPMDMRAIIDKVNNAHFVSVYRSIDAMLSAGLIKQVPLGFKNTYELSDRFMSHHHHATCEICNRSWKINDEKIEKMAKELTLEVGLKPTKHHFETYGTCKKCK